MRVLVGWGAESDRLRDGGIRWTHRYPGSRTSSPGCWLPPGACSLVVTPSDLVAYDPGNGHILWHAGVGAGVSNGPMTYELDGRQYLVVGAGENLFAFRLPE